eukprot:CAMPEP_0172615004 /NCGR_PEP_ID=MMETSP1068-20121228/55772_1 /TAXON_ID=35684 /ORGANISM="Pseudopedinella elastica, Strain CCMP716" /LENGTH=194 /DNA_ID=CAMNT_0013419995 /DNA_START=1 /DNA_END=585 /DNA_ORIENTATION=+
MVNTELDCANNSEQFKWLQKDLSGVNRTATPWIVVMGHRPIWDAQHWRPETRDENVGALEPLLHEWKVDLALYGHYHYAELTCPLLASGRCASFENDGDSDADGWAAPTHAVIGNGGQGFTPFPPKPPPFDVYESAREWGFASLEAPPPGRELVLRFWGDAAEGQDPPLRFTHVLQRAYPRTAAPQTSHQKATT